MALDYIPYIRKKIAHDELLSVGLCALVINLEGKILLEKRKDNGLYCLPGGSIDLYETVKEGVIREVYEETGIRLEEKDLSLFSVRSGEKMKIVYPNGDITHYVDLCFFAKVNKGEKDIAPKDEESTEIFFCDPCHLPSKESFLRGSYESIQKYLDGDFSITVD